MAWTRTKDSILSSPEGFWPNPQKEKFCKKQAPWGSPKNRNPQGILSSYDWTTQSFSYYQGAEVTTSNKFELLTEEDLLASDPSVDQIIPEEDGIILPDYVTLNNFIHNKNNLFDKTYYMYEKNKNFCSGYFPSFITLDNEKYNMISLNTNPDNIFDNYYLKTKGNKYVKQIINDKSKYNFEYFNYLRGNCQVYDTVIPQLFGNPLSNDNCDPHPDILTSKNNFRVPVMNSKSVIYRSSTGNSNPHSSRNDLKTHKKLSNE